MVHIFYLVFFQVKLGFNPTSKDYGSDCESSAFTVWTGGFSTFKLGYNDHGYNDHGYNDHGYNEHGYDDQGYNEQNLLWFLVSFGKFIT